jgi:small subunit ribosomal protein S20
MANSAQAKKRGRQIERRTEVNKARKSRIRTFLKKVDEALETGEEKLALDALKNAQPELMRGVSKGLMHKNTAARKMSRLSSRVKSLSKK